MWANFCFKCKKFSKGRCECVYIYVLHAKISKFAVSNPAVAFKKKNYFLALPHTWISFLIEWKKLNCVSGSYHRLSCFIANSASKMLYHCLFFSFLFILFCLSTTFQSCAITECCLQPVHYFEPKTSKACELHVTKDPNVS